ncbi:uncharacterized protein [Nicotiana sylvestris]|uniref:uncharacterized protein n=1 Tax=Nicotiana sylvestris TaxID=4096 RepID=UPI00388C7273
MGNQELQDTPISVSCTGIEKEVYKDGISACSYIHNEFADALATLSSMIQHPDKNFIDPIPVRIHDQLAYCAHVEEEADGKPRFHEIKKYLARGKHSELANRCTSTGATPYMLVYDTEAVIPAEVEIPSLSIMKEAELDDVEWVKSRYDQLALIDKKIVNAVYHGQLY